MSCEQCGSTVFRTFTTPTEPDEAAIDGRIVNDENRSHDALLSHSNKRGQMTNDQIPMTNQ